MEYLLLALLLAKLSFQLPHPSSDTVALHPRGSSAHSFGLTRVAPYISTVDASSSGPIKDVDAPKGLRRSKYLFPVTVEDQDFNLEIDTGSSDTWIIATNFECYYTYNRATDTFSGPLDQSACNFGATYTPGSGFQPLPPLYQLSSYGQSGEGTVRAVRGPFGKASISLGDITVQQQLIGAPNQSSFPAYGTAENSGILGLAFPGITGAFNASPPAFENHVLYSPIMQTLFDEKLVPTLQFSLALSRDDSHTGNGGILTIGGLPDNTSSVNIASSTPTSASLQIFNPSRIPYRTYYAINVDNFVVGSATANPGFQILVDSGADIFQVPSATADAMNALWSPTFDAQGYLPCEAELTEDIGITIGGRTYYINSEDLKGELTGGKCVSLIYESTAADGFLVGDPFLKNVLAVFDWANGMMEFYPRQYYES